MKFSNTNFSQQIITIFILFSISSSLAAARPYANPNPNANANAVANANPNANPQFDDLYKLVTSLVGENFNALTSLIDEANIDEVFTSLLGEAKDAAESANIQSYFSYIQTAVSIPTEGIEDLLGLASSALNDISGLIPSAGSASAGSSGVSKETNGVGSLATVRPNLHLLIGIIMGISVLFFVTFTC